MRKFFHYLAIFYGILFVLTGVLKSMGALNTFKIELGSSYFTVPVSDSLFYIIAVNFIGGLSFVIHSYGTLPKSKKKGTADVLDSDLDERKSRSKCRCRPFRQPLPTSQC